MSGEAAASPFEQKSNKTQRSPIKPKEPSLNKIDRTRSQSLTDVTNNTVDKPKTHANTHRTHKIPKPIIIKTEPTDDTTPQETDSKTITNPETQQNTPKTPTTNTKPTDAYTSRTEPEQTKHKDTNETQTTDKHTKPTVKQTQTTAIIRQNTETQTEIQQAEKTTLENRKPRNTEQPKTPQQNKMDRKQIQQQITAFVPEFNGADTPNRANELTRFLDAADSIHETLTTAEEKQTFTKMIKFKLTGDAYTRISRRPTEDYKTLTNILNDLYAQEFTLDELERNFTTIRQSYGESLRNYGYRLIETLEQYKTGFKNKYNLTKMEENYEKHLDQTATQIFKRGLNNTILQERVATYRAKDMADIINETSAIERMLTTTTQTHQATENQSIQPEQKTPQSTPAAQGKQVTCNYCQRPNHTWDICRTRMNAENTQKNAYQTHNYGMRAPFTPQHQPQYQHQRYQQRYSQPTQFPRNHWQPNYGEQRTNNQTYEPYQTQTNTNNYTNQNQNRNNRDTQDPQQPQQRPYNNTYQRYQNPNHNPAGPAPPQQPYIPNYRQPTYTLPNRPTKYCSHCKTTIGHTYEECRNKFRSNTSNLQQTNINQETRQQPQDSNLENMFSNMRINIITPQTPDNPENEANMYQGNASGSNQQ